ncbi:tetraacyldisaccharide 4'-kinase [Pontibacter chitinilyticus]|uniref:tetraacyldisaccharide 4'-kinase n=1 Tax=Pontibacter chitinilyticus TaxID=2674989 RepID=UPI00321B6BA6
MVKYLKMLLWPFSLLYGGVLQGRNFLYDKELLASQRFDLPVIAVGNLTVGGTGKTPHVEYLLRLLHKYKVATLSRGYKRQTKGFILADTKATAASLGDEPFQFHQDFPEVTVAVAEDRVLGVQQLQARVPDVAVVVLDDALQHRALQPSLRLLLTDYKRPFYSDFVLPAGWLREARSGAARADAIIVSKCPEQLALPQQQAIESQIRKYSRAQVPVFFSTFRYGQPVSIGSQTTLSNQLILVTGIANAAPLKEYLLAQGFEVLHHLAFPDHYTYTTKDLHDLHSRLKVAAHRQASVLTTRKDAVKLTGPGLVELTSSLPVFYLPIEVTFLKEKEMFDALILNHVQQFVT